MAQINVILNIKCNLFGSTLKTKLAPSVWSSKNLSVHRVSEKKTVKIVFVKF